MNRIEIENKKCHIFYKWNTPIEFVYDKLIMSLDELHISILPKKIDHPKCTILAKDTIVLDGIFHNYLKEYLFEYGICEECFSDISESIKATFSVCRNLKEPPSVLKILLQRVAYDVTNVQAIKNEHKVAIPL